MFLAFDSKRTLELVFSQTNIDSIKPVVFNFTVF